MKTAFIIKPMAVPRCWKRFRDAMAMFRNANPQTTILDWYTSETGESTARSLAAEAVRNGCLRVILVGGDGILNQGLNGILEAGNGTVPSDLIVGVIPTGTGNDFAWALGVPRDIERAFQILQTGRIKSVDLGQVNGRFFFNSVSFGSDADINRRADSLKGAYPMLPGNSAYLLAALKELRDGPSRYQISIKGDEINRSGPLTLLAITNGPRYGGMFKINPRAVIDDGFLDLCYIKPLNRLRALNVLGRTIKGTHGRLREVGFCHLAGEFTVFSAKPLPYEVDGETPEARRIYTVSVRPGAMRVLVPAS